MSQDNQDNQDNQAKNKYEKHFQKKYPWDGETEELSQEQFEAQPQPTEIIEPVEPTEAYEFRPPKINQNLAFLGLAIAGVIAGVIAIFKLSGGNDKPKPKPKPKPKTITKTITKVRAPTNEELKEYVKKQKKTKVVEETEAIEEEK